MSDELLRSEGYFFSHDGTRLYYHVYGEGEVTMAMADGIGCFGYVWPKWLKNFPRRMRMVHLHYRGHGKSDPPAVADNITIPDLARDFKLLFDHLGIEKSILVGHSMGVQVVLEFGHLYPERTAGLIPLCGSYGNPLDTFKNTKVLKVLHPFMKAGAHRWPRAVRAFWRNALPTPLGFHISCAFEINPDFIAREEFMPYLQDISTVDPLLFLDMLGRAQEHTAKPHLADMHFPVLIIGGEKDGFTPVWISQEMVRLLPDAEILIVPAGTHTAPLEFDQLVQLRIEKWLAQRFGVPMSDPREA